MEARTKNRITVVIKHALMILFAVTCIYPFVWMLGTSLKSPQEALANPAALWPAGRLHFETFSDVWYRLNFFRYFTNSMLTSVTVVVGVVILYSMVGFALACIDFKGNKIVFYGFISLILVPGLTVQIPLYLNMVALGMADTFVGLVLPMINGGGPFAVLLFRNFFRSMSKELYESAKIDGCSAFGIYARIYMPLGVPITGTVAILNFIGSWNAIQWPLIVLRSSRLFTLQIAMMRLDESAFTQWNVLMAGAIISVIPVIIVFMAFQKSYIRGLASGAIKG